MRVGRHVVKGLARSVRPEHDDFFNVIALPQTEMDPSARLAQKTLTGAHGFNQRLVNAAQRQIDPCSNRIAITIDSLQPQSQEMMLRIAVVA